MIYHSDEVPIDVGFSLTGLLPIHCFDTINLVLSRSKAIFLIFKSRAYFSVTSNCFKRRQRKRGNVIKPFAREIGTGQKFVSL